MSLFLNIQPNTFTFNGGGLIQLGGAGGNSKSPNVYVGLAVLLFGGTATSQKTFSRGDVGITSNVTIRQITAALSQPLYITTNRPLDDDITN